jgi:hypothetical protein
VLTSVPTALQQLSSGGWLLNILNSAPIQDYEALIGGCRLGLFAGVSFAATGASFDVAPFTGTVIAHAVAGLAAPAAAVHVGAVANDGKSAILIVVGIANSALNCAFVEPPVRFELTTARLQGEPFRVSCRLHG